MITTTYKLRPQPALAHLSDADREQISQWLMDPSQTYDSVRERVAKPRAEGGFDTIASRSTLQRLRDRTVVLHQINSLLDDKQNLTELLAAQNGQEVQWSNGTQQLVQRAAFKIAALPEQSTKQLTALLRIADHPRRSAIDEHKMKYLKLRENTHARLAAVAERRQRLAEKKYLDPKPTKKRNVKYQERLVRHLFGSLPPIVSGLPTPAQPPIPGSAPQPSPNRGSTLKPENSEMTHAPNTQPSPEDLNLNQTHGSDASTRWCEAQPRSGSSLNRTDLAELSCDAITETNAAPADQTASHVARASSPAGYGTVSVPVRRDETTTAPADPQSHSSPLPARDEGQGEGFRAYSNDARPADQNATPSTSSAEQNLSTHNPQLSTPATAPNPPQP
ncbi:MAG TPA: hypothetical protein VF773_17925 [Verrucomicrobiae bacterium]